MDGNTRFERNINSRFQLGSGVYSCCSCGKRTRETGEGESGCELCRECFELSGLQNMHSDGRCEGLEACPFCSLPDPWKVRISGLSVREILIESSMKAKQDNCQ